MNQIITAIIPARGGSKGIPHKNIIKIAGYPLIAYSIAAAKLSTMINRIIVSTDSEEIANIGKKYGAEVPFLRPSKFATDKSPDIEFIQHALSWFADNEHTVPDLLVHLRPTTPLRDPDVIDEAINQFIQKPQATCLRSAHEIRESPYKMFGVKRGYFVGLFPTDPRPEYYNLPRQSFPPVYQPDGYVDILKSKYIIKSGKLHGDKILAFVCEDTGELDRKEDVERVEYFLTKKHYKIYKYLKNNFPL
jgi:CMP-N,N'-diacetyllegionaminic acid synthase